MRYCKALGRRLITIEIIVDKYRAPQGEGRPEINHQENRVSAGFRLGCEQYALRAL